jgi:K(+)-stimulated pyrophosphate-energized sodium pump
MVPKRFQAWAARAAVAAAAFFTLLSFAGVAKADEADLKLPDLSSVKFMGSVDGRTLLMAGMGVSLLGFVFGVAIFMQLNKLPVHKAMKEISELIYETCKTYLITQLKFILMLEVLIGAIMVVYFGVLRHFDAGKVALILFCSLVGIAGSSGVAWFGMRINTFANSRTAFAALRGKPFPTYAIPLKAGMSIGTVLISVELFVMLTILLFVPRDSAGVCFIGFAIGESLGASALRIAGGIFTKIADIGSDLMKIVFNIKEDDARNPGVIADCTGDNAGDSVGPSADGFETYGVTGVALISFIILAVNEANQVQLLVWIFAMRIMMVVASVLSYLVNEAVAKGRYGNADKMDFEQPLTSLVWLTSLVSLVMTFVVSYLLIPTLGDGTLWWKLAAIISCGTLAGAVIPELVKIFTSTTSGHVKEVVTSSREGGASLNVLSGLVAGNFSAYWLGIAIVILTGVAYLVSLQGLHSIMIAEPVFAFGLVAFGFLGMGPVTIAVDSYGPVTDNAQSSTSSASSRRSPTSRPRSRRTSASTSTSRRPSTTSRRTTAPATPSRRRPSPCSSAPPWSAATTMIFSIIMVLTKGLQRTERPSPRSPSSTRPSSSASSPAAP